ncbi:Molybdopterin or thiamine biosynthesis adenylyltransferase [Acetomicrobium thermoterrenum DSM 13490]|uniref:Molybdopterin or thiamine biosynthesis adenylyltransferase n=1 Tax=Acetomicrobium thermoterrenum DSM 13490 TaxID=1120987 RepID=A0A1H3GN45_9BACT|nr:HesA/MoeB/ThiF family protein [Acetomicrobium thermoterrenum]SDY04048.1 Molybdopterin or thiamine biosynthesis adenylyltransferase [Acetomicrobium thermoterrenum DSM 13490]
MMTDIIEKLKAESYRKNDNVVIPFESIKNLSKEYKTPVKSIEIELLENGLIPERYERNIGTYGISGQLVLLKSKILIVGCGGLGGWNIEILARAGVGYLRLVDGDRFEPHNLNRQIIATENDLYKPKALIAAKRVKNINSGIEAEACSCMFDESTAQGLVDGMDLAIDALDNNRSRFLLFQVCKAKGIPVVHGAIGGFVGQLKVVMPGESHPLEAFGNDAPDKGIEVKLGNPPQTPALIATLQANEAIKLLLKKEGLLTDHLLWIDLEHNEWMRLKL